MSFLLSTSYQSTNKSLLAVTSIIFAYIYVSCLQGAQRKNRHKLHLIEAEQQTGLSLGKPLVSHEAQLTRKEAASHRAVVAADHSAGHNYYFSHILG